MATGHYEHANDKLDSKTYLTAYINPASINATECYSHESLHRIHLRIQKIQHTSIYAQITWEK